MTIIDGLMKLTRPASTPPTRRPPSRMSLMQVTSPSAAPSATSFAVTVPLACNRSASAGDVPAFAAAVASRASAAPPNRASRQPTLPHEQTGPWLSTWMCPMSPADPSVPR
jgi:hypothetical protein